MRIGMVCYPTYGGSGVVATELGLQLAQRGHQVHFISYERPFRLNEFHENVLLHEVGVSDYPLFRFPPYSIALASTIVQVVKEHKLDVVHAHYAIPHAVSAYLAKQMLGGSLPVITTLHGTDITLVGSDRQFFDITKFCIEQSDGVTTVSRQLAQETANTFQISRPIKTIYNFIDPQVYRREEKVCRRSHFAQPEEKIIIHISNFRSVKRIADVVRVFHGISQQIPSKLLLVGDGPDRAEAVNLVHELKIEGKVHFLGKQEGVVPLLSIADLMLLPSEKESFGLVALEAMACQVPVVATQVGGIPEVVQPGVTGCLAQVGDVAGMVKCGVNILSNPSVHSAMSNKAREVATTNFHVDTIVDEYEKFYVEVLNQVAKK